MCAAGHWERGVIGNGGDLMFGGVGVGEEQEDVKRREKTVKEENKQ